MEGLYISLIIAIAVVLCVYLLRDRLTSLSTNIKGKQGKREIGGNATFNASRPNTASTTVKGNILRGKKNIMRTKTDSAQIEGNKIIGEEQELSIEDSPNLSKLENDEN